MSCVTRHDPAPTAIGHVTAQTRSVGALLKVAAMSPFKGGGASADGVETPGQLVSVQLPPLPSGLLAAYCQWTGGLDADAVPAHLFPQWTFPPMISALSVLPFPMTAVLNQGCRIESHAPLPKNETLNCTAQLTELLQEESKIKITTKISTGTASAPNALDAFVYAVIPQPKKGKSPAGAGGATKPPPAKREPARVPAGAVVVSEHALLANSGLHYAYVSGDFNPIHWIPPYARMAGFKSVILHGFAQMALMSEALVRARCGGDAALLRVLDVRFIAPLVLPNTMQVHVCDADSTIYVTTEGGKVHMIGSFEYHAKPPLSKL